MGLLTVAMCWAFAVLLYRVGVPGSVARKLAVLLVAEGFILVTGGYPELLFTPAVFERSWFSDWRQIAEFVHHVSDCTMLALYPPFLAAALQTKLTRPVCAVMLSSAGTASVRTMPSGVSSKAQAKIRAIGRPSSNTATMTASNQTGSPSDSSSVVEICASIQPTTA